MAPAAPNPAELATREITADLMRAHIERRRDAATAAVREAYAQLYVPEF